MHVLGSCTNLSTRSQLCRRTSHSEEVSYTRLYRAIRVVFTCDGSKLLPLETKQLLNHPLKSLYYGNNRRCYPSPRTRREWIIGTNRMTKSNRIDQNRRQTRIEDHIENECRISVFNFRLQFLYLRTWSRDDVSSDSVVDTTVSRVRRTCFGTRSNRFREDNVIAIYANLVIFPSVVVGEFERNAICCPTTRDRQEKQSNYRIEEISYSDRFIWQNTKRLSSFLKASETEMFQVYDSRSDSSESQN